MAKEKRSQALPEQVFHLLAALIPEFGRVLEGCGLNGVEFVALLYLKHQGRNVGDGRIALVQKDFREDVLRREFNYSPGDTDVFLKRMEEKGLLKRQRLTPYEKQAAFGTSKGRLSAVMLSRDGVEKIEQVKEEINRLYSSLTSHIPVVRRRMLYHLVSRSENLVAEILRALELQKSSFRGQNATDDVI